MRATIVRTLVGLSVAVLASGHVFEPKNGVVKGPSSLLGAAKNNSKSPSLATHRPELLLLRGGDADYSGAARGLFANLISPSALLAGSLMPLGFLAPPLPGRDERLRQVYSLVAISSLCNVAAAIIYATVASNKLVEITAAPATSVFALIQRDYELSWIATNVHFLLGLFGFLSMIGMRAFLVFPARIQKAAAGIAVSALLGMCSVVNRGVSAGDGTGHVHGSSILTLLGRYMVLLASQVKNSGGVLAIASIVVGLVSVAFAVRAVIVGDAESDEKTK